MQESSFGLAKGRRRWLEVQIPILAFVRFSGAEGQRMSRRQFVDILEKGFFAGKVVEGEKPVDHRSADFRLHFRIGKNCFDLGSKHDGVPRLRVIQGLNSDAIAGEKE